MSQSPASCGAAAGKLEYVQYVIDTLPCSVHDRAINPSANTEAKLL